MQLADFVPSKALRMPLTAAGFEGSYGSGRSQHVTIAAARCEGTRQHAGALLNQRYSWRGYDEVHLPQVESVMHLPLTATQDGVVIGTLTVGLDGPAGLNCDRSFHAEVEALRDTGSHLCEFTKLAVDPAYGSDQVLAAMFHVAYLATDRLTDADRLLMEVNPRHQRYYMRMLGATVIGGVRSNTMVNAPAVLLSMSFSEVRRKIDESAGRPRVAGAERCLYTHFFNHKEESAIVNRLLEHIPGSDNGAPFGFRLPQVDAAAPVHH